MHPTYEDVLLATRYPQVKAIVISNHGSRGLDTASPLIHALLEIREFCATVFDKLEVYTDGGIHRGKDVVKALCLGTRAVGVGRAPLYELGIGGKEGVERVFQILRDETKTAMQLLGCNSVGVLSLRYVNTKAVERDIL